MPIQQCPGYHQGFWDAGNLEPLFPDADPAYAAGWLAYWEIRVILDVNGNRVGSYSHS